MSPPNLLLLALAGGLGAALRFAVDAEINRRVRTELPLGTLLVNVTGSLLLGLIAGLAQRESPTLPSDLLAIAGTGLCGGYTTFSTASVEAARLWIADGPSRAGGYALLTLVACVLAALVGMWAGR